MCPNADPAAYQLALRQAQAACRLVPENPFGVAVLGAAQYRAGQYQAAVRTLRRADKLSSFPAQGKWFYLAYLAMAQYHLGQKKQAHATLREARKTLRRPMWVEEGLLREAEALIEKKPAGRQK